CDDESMRRHVHWILLLITAPLAYVLLMLAAQALEDGAGNNVGLALARLALMLAAVITAIALLIRAIVQMARTYRRGQRSTGRYTRMEQEMLERGQRTAEAWEQARSVREILLNRQVPGSLRQWEVVPYPDEVFLAHVP